MTDDLAEFLMARIAEDEAAARAATLGPWEVRPYWYTAGGRSFWASVPDVIDEDIHGEDAAHIARWDPARVLAECEACRRVVELHTDVEGTAHPCPERGAFDDEWVVYEAGQRVVKTYPCPTLRLLALSYASHPDYRSEWAP